MAPIKKRKAPLGKTFIGAWREHRALTQDQASEMADLSRSSLSKIETGEAPYTQRTLEALARAYGCQPFELLIRDPGGSDRRSHLIALVQALPDSALDYIEGAMEARTESNNAQTRKI